MNPSRNVFEVAELSELSSLVYGEVTSTVPTRWERKQQTTPARKRQQQQQLFSPKQPSPSSLRPRNDNVANTCSFPSNNVSAKPIIKRSRLAGASPQLQRCGSDRFIPSRSALDFDNASYRTNLATRLEDDSARDDAREAAFAATPGMAEYHQMMQATLGASSDNRILSFKSKAPKLERDAVVENGLTVLYSTQGKRSLVSNPRQASMRQIPTAALKILDAPGLIDDFYINPLDWSATNNVAVALGPSVYLWNAASGHINELTTMDTEEGSLDHVSSVAFDRSTGSTLAVGSTDNTVALWDVEKGVALRTLRGHVSRVSALAWNGSTLTSGGRDATIFHHDVRLANHIVSTLSGGHSGEVCSTKWNEEGTSLATGGNDNRVCVWDARVTGPRLALTQHQAAVKALAWCPYQRNVLATGGGTSDRTIKIWNTTSGKVEKSIDTGSQVCSLVFNPNERELLSSHGYSENELTLWKYPTMSKIKDLTGHTARVLHTAVSPDGTTVCSAGADETLRFWECFGSTAPPAKKKDMVPSPSRVGGLRQRIR